MVKTADTFIDAGAAVTGGVGTGLKQAGKGLVDAGKVLSWNISEMLMAVIGYWWRCD